MNSHHYISDTVAFFIFYTSSCDESHTTGEKNITKKIVKTEKEWKKKLTPEQYQILREKGTEMAFSGKYVNYHEVGTYHCAGCGQPLFSSKAKFESGSGWPSFTQPYSTNAIEQHEDISYRMKQIEVRCSRCNGHLGHVFDDGPPPTGIRYCINSAALDFKKNNE